MLTILLIAFQHSVYCGISLTPSKTLPHSFLQSPPSNWQTVQAPFFLGNPPSILVFCEPPSKSWIFQWTPKILKFFILNTIYLLKITKFLVKIPHFEFLAMTEKNIFVYKPFLTSNFQLLIYFYVKIATHPLKKVTISFPAIHLYRLRSFQALTFGKFGWWFSAPLPPCRTRGVHTMSR